jgi:transcriptional regulator with XRE-family HTH domain
MSDRPDWAVELILARNTHSLSQQALAGLLGVSRERVAQVEAGRRHPGRAFLARVEAAFATAQATEG